MCGFFIREESFLVKTVTKFPGGRCTCLIKEPKLFFDCFRTSHQRNDENWSFSALLLQFVIVISGNLMIFQYEKSVISLKCMKPHFITKHLFVNVLLKRTRHAKIVLRTKPSFLGMEFSTSLSKEGQESHDFSKPKQIQWLSEVCCKSDV